MSTSYDIVITVDADTEEEAREIAIERLQRGDGYDIAAAE